MTPPHRPGSPGCRELFARLSEYLDGELEPGLCEEAEAHLNDCPPCQDFLESLRRTVEWIRGLPADPALDAIRREVREALGRLRRPE